ncbi:DUF3224 domain-containing protein [Nocardiopsis sp. NPDC101807]|uniref:DUF3224 domain-containing protein n=1 Tax=Nocardiopsis sp. NPDC101807 TaxID=3364339 RepID=UPI003801595F
MRICGRDFARATPLLTAGAAAALLTACSPVWADPGDGPTPPDGGTASPTQGPGPGPGATPGPSAQPSTGPTPGPGPSPSQEQTATAVVHLLDQTVEEIGPPDDPSGTQILNTVFQTDFVGDLDGKGYHVYLDLVDASGGATSEGAGRFVGSLNGVQGTFAMDAWGTADPGGAISAEWCVVDGSASGDLAGLSGCGQILTDGTPEAHVTLTYTLP